MMLSGWRGGCASTKSMMSELNPKKLQVTFLKGSEQFSAKQQRRYTLTHSDATGNMFLIIGPEYDNDSISGWYTRLMRDEVLAEWIWSRSDWAELHVYCHVSGGFIFGSAKWRTEILLQHMPLALQAICSGDRALLQEASWVSKAPLWVHFLSDQSKWDRISQYGCFADHVLLQ